MAPPLKLNANFLNKVRVAFSAWDRNSVCAREFLQYARCRIASGNPRCVVEGAVKHDASEPIVEVTYADGSQQVFRTREHKATPLIKLVAAKTRELELRAQTKAPAGKH